MVAPQIRPAGGPSSLSGDTWTTRPVSTHPQRAQRLGYVLAILVNLVLLYVVQHVLVWHWPAFVTDAFEQLVPIMSFSLVVSMLVNFMFIWFDAGWFKSLANIVTAGIALLVTVRLWQVFPFDYSSYAHDWAQLTRIGLVFVMFATAIAIVVELVNLLTWPVRHASRDEE